MEIKATSTGFCILKQHHLIFDVTILYKYMNENNKYSSIVILKMHCLFTKEKKLSISKGIKHVFDKLMYSSLFSQLVKKVALL